MLPRTERRFWSAVVTGMTPEPRIARPFANGTEGTAWEQAWCARCIHDHDPNHGPDGVIDTGCIFLTLALAGEPTPLIWQPMERDWWRTLPAGIACRAFEPCACDCPEAAKCREPREDAR